MENKNTYQKIYEVVKQIPKGKVASYSLVARLVGNSKLTRVVGYALHQNKDNKIVPCHRVVTKDGYVSDAFIFGGANKQVELLKSEGIKFIKKLKKDKNKKEKEVEAVDMKEHLWDRICW